MSMYLGSQKVSLLRPRLPYEYQEVEYIESTGIQYIDTGVMAKSGVSAKAKLMWREISSDSGLLGARSGGNRIYLLYQYPALNWNIGYGGNYSAGQFEQDVIYDVEVVLLNGAQKLVVNGTTVWGNSLAQDYDLGTSIYLFTYNQDGNPASYYAKARIYHLEMYVNDVLVRNFIPCYRKEDGEIGLFDLVEQKFYANQRDTVFLKGDDDTKIIEFEQIMDTDFPDDADTLLPWDFQQVEYIESTGSQLINTEAIQTNNVTIDCHFYADKASSNYMFGSSQDMSITMMYNGLYNTNLLEYDWKEVPYTASNNIVMTQRLDGTNTVITINDQTFILPTGKTSNDTTVYIFGCNNGTRLYPYPLRCYYFKMYENNVLIRDFVPCYRKSDGEIGLYDLVERKFYANQGTGTFLKGGNVK